MVTTTERTRWKPSLLKLAKELSNSAAVLTVSGRSFRDRMAYREQLAQM